MNSAPENTEPRKRLDLPRIGDEPIAEEQPLAPETPTKKRSLNNKVEKLIEDHPDRALKVVRRWMDEG